MKKRSGRISQDELTSLINSQISSASQYNRTELHARRERTLLFLNGKVDFGSESDKSSVVCNDLSDQLNSVMPSLLRVFTSADQLVVYTPRRPEFDPMTGQEISVEKAKQATDYVNHVFQNECDGYRVIHSALYSGMAFGNGIIKHWWDPNPVEFVETLTGLTEIQYNQLLSDPDVKIDTASVKSYADPAFAEPGAVKNDGEDETETTDEDAVSEEGYGEEPEDNDFDEQTGLEAPEILPEEPNPLMDQMEDALEAILKPPMLYDLQLTRTLQRGRVRVVAVADEEFMISKEATALTEDECGGFVGHAYRETRGELLRQKISREKVEKLSISAWTEFDNKKEERSEMTYSPSEVDRDWAEELVWVYETYIRVDYNGTGQSSWRQVLCGGDPGAICILKDKAWGGMLPFSDFVPEPIPHRWHGRSLLDNVYDYTRVRTTLLRQALDNAYQTNNPLTWVEEESITNIDVLADRELGGVVIGKLGSQPPRPLEVPFTSAQTFQMFETLGKMVEQRTGIAAQGPALDMQALQNQTATAVQAAQSTAYSRPETFARNISQMGMKRLFRCLLKLIVSNQDRARTILLRGKWVEMDPRSWDAEMNLAINIGLGSGSRERDLTALAGILIEQKQAMGQLLPKLGPINSVVGVDKIIHTLHKMVESSGLRSPDQFFGMPSPEDMKKLQAPSEPPPDPKMAQIQASAQIEMAKFQAKMQADAQAQVHKAQQEQQRQLFDMQMRQMEAEKDALAEQAKLDKQAEIERIQAQADIAVRDYEAKANTALERQRAEHQQMLMEIKSQNDRMVQGMRVAMEGLKGQVASGDILAVLSAFGMSVPEDLAMRMDLAKQEQIAQDAMAQAEGALNGAD